MAIATGFTPCATALDGLRRGFFPERYRVGSYFVASQASGHASLGLGEAP
jgi:hypothetical protein